MPPRRPLPDTHHIMRYVPYQRLLRHPETDEVLGLTAGAFDLRPNDDGRISVTWIEYFGAFGDEARRDAAAAHREDLLSKKLSAKAAFAWATVDAVRRRGAEHGRALRVVHSPTDNNPGHAEVRHFTDADLDMLASFVDVFSDFRLVGEMGVPSRGE